MGIVSGGADPSKLPLHCVHCHKDAIAYARGQLHLVLANASPTPEAIVNLQDDFNRFWFLRAPEYDRRQALYRLRRHMDRMEYREAFDYMRRKIERRLQLTRK